MVLLARDKRGRATCLAACVAGAALYLAWGCTLAVDLDDLAGTRPAGAGGDGGIEPDASHGGAAGSILQGGSAGAGGKAGASGSSAGGAGGSAGVDGGTTPDVAEEPAPDMGTPVEGGAISKDCQGCVQGNCPNEVVGCYMDPPCTAAWNCLVGCTDPVYDCIQNCGGGSKMSSLMACLQAHCTADCLNS